MKIDLIVEGMSCKGCENRIQNALLEIEEIESVMADHIKKEVKVTIKKEIDINIIKETIENLGFEVIE